METYAPPAITELGSLHELTLSSPINKIGTKADQYTGQGPIVGDLTPAVS
jgi:Na+/citrate or Na+/malate symporter